MNFFQAMNNFTTRLLSAGKPKSISAAPTPEELEESRQWDAWQLKCLKLGNEKNILQNRISLQREIIQNLEKQLEQAKIDLNVLRKTIMDLREKLKEALKETKKRKVDYKKKK